jgi:hypothetical protein
MLCVTTAGLAPRQRRQKEEREILAELVAAPQQPTLIIRWQRFGCCA